MSNTQHDWASWPGGPPSDLSYEWCQQCGVLKVIASSPDPTDYFIPGVETPVRAEPACQNVRVQTLEQENAKLRAALAAAVKVADQVAVNANPRAYRVGNDHPMMNRRVPDDPKDRVIESQAMLSVHSAARQICAGIADLATPLGVDLSACVTLQQA